MPTPRRALTTGCLGLALLCTAVAAPAQTGDALYVCTDPGATRTVDIGATICDATPTGTLNRAHRARQPPASPRHPRHRGVARGHRPGGGGSGAGDVIYRVGGVDVEDNVEAAARLSLLVESADTVVNFLRRGRPYLVRLRRP